MTEVTTNSMMQLSEHFRLGEFTKSSYPEVYREGRYTYYH